MATKKTTPAEKKPVKKKRAAPKKARAKGGRPTDYKPTCPEQAKKLCLLGATDRELADFFGVVESTINKWKLTHPKFSESIRDGRDKADAEIANSLYHRALGYSHPEVDIRVIDKEIVKTALVKHYPPDTEAAKHWLNNRQRGKWRNKIDQEISGPNGGPIEQNVTLTPEEAYRQMLSGSPTK